MLEYLSRLFDTSGFPRRWECGSAWTDELGWMHIVSDLLVWSAYFTIPLVLLYFVLQKKDLPFRTVFLLFGAFILFCGMTHLMDAAIFWWPAYRLAGLLKLGTAIVSWGTVVALIPILPQAFALRSPVELEQEIAERKAVEEKLLALQHELEERVRQRTADLEATNRSLQEEIARRERAQETVRESEVQLHDALADLREADQQKDEFLAVLAHELRNPLAPIGNALEIMRLAPHDHEAATAARATLGRQFEHLVRLVDDLLDVSRIRRGKIDLRPEPCTLASLVGRAVETAQPLVAAANHTLVVNLPREPISLVADPVRITQAIANLLNNAAKYTEPGGRIELSAEAVKDAAGEQEIEIRVRDSGVGISPEQLPTVFDMFLQAIDLNRTHGGLGIGLTLVKRLIELHGGEVQAASAGLGRGSEFTIRLPWVQPAAPPASPPQPKKAAPQVAAWRILVVDDNRDAAQTLGYLLRANGHAVKVGHDGPAALALAEEFRPEIIVLDIGMPEMDGLEVARRIRASDGSPRPVLVALTGWGAAEDRERTAQAGFDFHLVKPVRLEDLEQILSSPNGK